MPKRIVDGEALWTSTKIRRLPLKYRLHYANWLPLAAANGVFEIDLDAIRSRVYAASLHPSFTSKSVFDVLCEFTQVGLLQVWMEDEKVWGYFLGIEKAGRLPGKAVLQATPTGGQTEVVSIPAGTRVAVTSSDGGTGVFLTQRSLRILPISLDRIEVLRTNDMGFRMLLQFRSRFRPVPGPAPPRAPRSRWLPPDQAGTAGR